MERTVRTSFQEKRRNHAASLVKEISDLSEGKEARLKSNPPPVRSFKFKLIHYLILGGRYQRAGNVYFCRICGTNSGSCENLRNSFDYS
jgi:hypothetical protein